MINTIDDFRREFDRKAIVMEIGGFRPTDSLSASWFGRVNLAGVGESWPYQDGVPMHALAQINLTEFPFRPPRLDDIDFITVFIGPDTLPVHEKNGSNWMLRTYKTIADLIPLANPDTRSPIRPFPMRPMIVEHDLPCRDDVPFNLLGLMNDAYYEGQIETARGFKLGGWPDLIQSEIDWAPGNKHPYQPEYVFQIDSDQKAHWRWADFGVGYFGRGTAESHRDDWVLEWQCD